MDNKETEKFIEETLNSEKPNRRILFAAKEAMSKKKQSRNKLYWVYGLSGCSAILVSVGIILSIIKDTSYSSSGLMNSINASAISNLQIFAIVLISIGAVLGIMAVIFLIKYIKRK